jgi:hypothetical protein
MLVASRPTQVRSLECEQYVADTKHFQITQEILSNQLNKNFN